MGLRRQIHKFAFKAAMISTTMRTGTFDHRGK